MFTLQHLTRPDSAATTSARRPASPRPIIIPPHPPLQTLAALVDAAAVRPLEDRAGWAQLTAAARRVVDESIAHGHVPAVLAIEEGEPPVVVRRTIAAAWRHATRTVGHGADGRE